MMSNKTKAELEERVKELEAEVKRLKEFENQQIWRRRKKRYGAINPSDASASVNRRLF